MKKIMAPGCETESIANLMKAARPFSYGMCMAGAGGGGFMYVLTKDKEHKQLLIDLLPTIEVCMRGGGGLYGRGRRGVHVCTDQGQGTQTTADRSAASYRGGYDNGWEGLKLFDIQAKFMLAVLFV